MIKCDECILRPYDPTTDECWSCMHDPNTGAPGFTDHRVGKQFWDEEEQEQYYTRTEGGRYDEEVNVVSYW